MTKNKLQTIETEYVTNPGSFQLKANDLFVTDLRGLHIEVKTPNGTVFSSEASDWKQANSKSGHKMQSNFTLIPLRTEWQLQKSSRELKMNVTLNFREDVDISWVSLSAELNPSYKIFSIQNKKEYVLEDRTGCLWSGYPADETLQFESSSSDYPPLRIKVGEETSFYEMQILRDKPKSGFFIRMKLYGADSGYNSIKKGERRTISLTISNIPSNPETIKYPLELFSGGSLKNILIVSAVNAYETQKLIDHIRRVLPVSLKSGKVGPPNIYLIAETEDSGDIKDVKILSEFRNLSETISTARSYRKKYAFDLLIRLQPDIHASFGGRFNLFSMISRSKYKCKMDPAGNNSFRVNLGPQILKRKLSSLKGSLKLIFIKFIKLSLLILYMICFPFLVIKDHVFIKD